MRGVGYDEGKIIDGLCWTLQLSWAAETSALLASDEIARDVQGVEEMTQRHNEQKTEIESKDQKYGT